MRRLRRSGPAAAAVARVRRVARVGGRVAVLTAVACALGLVAVQIVGIVAKNVTVARQLAASRTGIATLRARERVQESTIVRLSDPRGAVPEIHDKLHVVGDREEIIYVRGLGPGAAGPGEWRPQP